MDELWKSTSGGRFQVVNADGQSEDTVELADPQQIGWFDPGSKRFCYSDEKEAWPDARQGYTVPVFIFGITDG